MYRFEPLSQENKTTWLKVADECDYAPLNALDNSLIDMQLEDRSAASAILYENDKAVALFPGQIVIKNIGPISMRIIQSRFGGLLITEDHISQASLLKDFMIREVLNEYYARRLKADYLELVLPPKVMIEKSSFIRTFLPFDKSDVGVNSILYTKLNDGLLDKFDYNVKWEIKKGLDNISRARVIEEKDINALSIIAELEAAKASKLKIKAIPQSYFERFLHSSFYHIRIAVMDGRPVSAVIYTLCKDVSTFSYNTSTEEGKRNFINKALLYISMQNCHRAGARYFILGNGREYSGNTDEERQLKNLAFFKKRFSTDEVATFRFRHVLTKKGALALAIDRFLNRRSFKDR
jgi:hypothetical protein